MFNGDVDLAVHSSKDMPAVLPDGLEVGAVLEREDPRDALVMPVGKGSFSGDDVKRIGTGSVRRIAQLRARFPHALFENVRGNLDTRLRKLDAGEYDLLVLAAAGLRRLGFTSRISALVPLDECVPAPGQGIIAIEVRGDDAATRRIVTKIADADALAALDAERALVTTLGGGCQMPIGGIAVPVGQTELELRALVASLDGARVIRYKKVGPRTYAAALGREVADELLRQGAAAILNEASHGATPNPDSLHLT